MTIAEADAGSDSKAKTGFITVFDIGSVASFSATTLSGNKPWTVSFTDTSASCDSIVSWLWDFGDGQTSTEQNPSHEYAQDGFYTVSMTVTDSNGSSVMETKTDYVKVKNKTSWMGFAALGGLAVVGIMSGLTIIRRRNLKNDKTS